MKIILILATFAVLFIKESPAIPIEEKIINSHFNQLGIFKSIDKLHEEIQDLLDDLSPKIVSALEDTEKEIAKKDKQLIEDPIKTIKKSEKKLSKHFEALFEEIDQAKEKADSEGKDTEHCSSANETFSELYDKFLNELQLKCDTAIKSGRDDLEIFLVDARELALLLDAINTKFQSCEDKPCLESVLEDIDRDLVKLPKKIKEIGDDASAAVKEAIAEIESYAERIITKYELEGKLKSEELILCYEGLPSSTTEKVSNDNTEDDDNLRDQIKSILDEKRPIVEAAIEFTEKEISKQLNKLDEEIVAIIRKIDDKFLKTYESLLNDVEEAEQKALSDGKNTDPCKKSKDNFLELSSQFLDELQEKCDTIEENTRADIEYYQEIVQSSIEIVDTIENKFNGCNDQECLESVMNDIQRDLIPLPEDIQSMASAVVEIVRDTISEVESDAKSDLSAAKVDAEIRSDTVLFCYEGLQVW